MASSSNANPTTDAQQTEAEPLPFPKPSAPEASSPPASQRAPQFDILSDPPSDPPPPYPAARKGRRARGHTGRSARHVSQPSDDSPVGVPDNVGESETSPLLGTRQRTTSHSSTVHSVQSLAHTVFSLFEAEPEGSSFMSDTDPRVSSSSARLNSDHHFLQRARRYFRPLTRRAYYAALFHLLVINFPYELGAWVFLFVGTLTGTMLLITLPLGAIICFLDLLGARTLARGEIALQTCFHGPLSVPPASRRFPIFSRMRTPSPETSVTSLEIGRPPVLTPETSFLRLTYLMFRDPTSYQALFYFLVIKPGLTLLITLALIILIPPAFVLVIPAPAVLRAVRRVGVWQAEVALDALGCN